MLKSKKTKFIVFLIISIVVLISILPLINNLDYIIRLKGIKTQHIDGDVDVDVNIHVGVHSGIISSLSYTYYTEFEMTYNESVSGVEVEEIHYRIDHNGVNIESYDGPYFSNIRFIRSVDLYYGDNLSCEGSIELNYQLDSNPENDTVNFNLTYNHNIRDQDAYANINIKNAIFIGYIASFFVIPFILFFTIHPDFYTPSKEEKERSDEIVDFLAKRKEENSN